MNERNRLQHCSGSGGRSALQIVEFHKLELSCVKKLLRSIIMEKFTTLDEKEDRMLDDLCQKSEKSSYIDPEFYKKYEVKRGLRDISGKGVLAGLTEIGEVHSYVIDENEIIPVDGRLYLSWHRHK